MNVISNKDKITIKLMNALLSYHAISSNLKLLFLTNFTGSLQLLFPTLFKTYILRKFSSDITKFIIV
jgi:hypothetical protein